MGLFRTLALLSIISFALHFVWEFSHAGLYAGYGSWSGDIPIYWLATLGDVLYTLGAFALMSAIKQTYDWMHSTAASDYLTLVALGFLIALFVEYKSIVLERWHYLPDMPIIPILNVGLSPVLEMSILLPLSVFLTAYALKFMNR